jgi:uracil-DNA glycosylase family 4
VKTQAEIEWNQLHQQVIHCDQCPRLRKYCKQIAKEKRRAFMDQDYWGKPVPGFGDPQAQLWLVGLAPAAHGANRTGRMFTGDNSGLWLYRALHRAGFANQALSEGVQDGLQLSNAYVSAVGRCAPPQNKLEHQEIQACRPFLLTEKALLRPHLRVVLALGAVAWKAVLELFRDEILSELGSKFKTPAFGHGVELEVGFGSRFGSSYESSFPLRRLLLKASFHPSQQNTFTKKLTEPMLDQVMSRCRDRVG